MTTTDYWTTSAAASPAVSGPEKDHRAVNWRLVLALGLNIAVWAAVFKTL